LFLKDLNFDGRSVSSSSSNRDSDLGFHGQSYPLVVIELEPLPFELLLENTVLFYAIINDHLLVAVKPAGQGNYEEMERLYDVCHCRTDYP